MAVKNFLILCEKIVHLVCGENLSYTFGVWKKDDKNNV